MFAVGFFGWSQLGSVRFCTVGLHVNEWVSQVDAEVEVGP